MENDVLNLEELILYRDALILALNKPSGIAVHGGNGRNDALDRGFDSLRFGLPRKPELVHRLDKDTSGVLLLGRNREGLRRCGELFQRGLAQKTYMAWVEGVVAEDEGLIDAPLGKQSPHKHRWWMKVDPEGQDAQTRFRVGERLENRTLLELKPLTGRTHQLRVHCAHLGHPIVGDAIYGKVDTLPMRLHAAEVILPLYPKKDPLVIRAPLPDYFL